MHWIRSRQGITTEKTKSECDDPLALFWQRYSDEDGPDVDDVANVIDLIWKNGKDNDLIKITYDNYHRPSNVLAKKVDINEEVLPLVNKPALSRDMRVIQSAIAGATVPSVKIIQTLHKLQSRE